MSITVSPDIRPPVLGGPDDDVGADRKGGEASHRRRYGREPPTPRRYPIEAGQVLTDRNTGREQCGVRGSGRVVGVVDVQAVDPDEADPALDQRRGRRT